MGVVKTVETSLDMSRCHFWTVKIFSTGEMSVFEMSRSRVSTVETHGDRDRYFSTSRDLLFFKLSRLTLKNVKIETLDWDHGENRDFRLEYQELRLGFWNCRENLNSQDLLFKLTRSRVVIELIKNYTCLFKHLKTTLKICISQLL